jgi:DNA-binding transcriptional LysR family regulator
MAFSIHFYWQRTDCLPTIMPESSEIRGLSTDSVSIGTAYTSMFIPLRRLMADFQKSYPHIVFHLTSGFRTELCQDLLEHRLDFAIIGKK